MENGENVIYFDISYNELEFFPDDIKIMTSVQYFLAGFNLLESIPGPAFAAFEKYFPPLPFISLSLVLCDSIPDTKTKRLLKLDLSNNKISKLPDEITEIVSLQELYLHKNMIAELPESFRMLTRSLFLFLFSFPFIST